MRRVVLVFVSLAAVFAACRTTQPPGAENQNPIGTVGTEREPIQTVPSGEGGPAEPLPDAPDGGAGPEPD
jgi:hypothetical protein